MPTYLVTLDLGFDQRPSRHEQAFLTTLNAQAQPWGTTDLQARPRAGRLPPIL